MRGFSAGRWPFTPVLQLALVGLLGLVGLVGLVPLAGDAGAVSLVRTIGSRGTGDGQLNHPLSVAVAATGFPQDVYVVDRLNDRIEEFTTSGQFVRTFGNVFGKSGRFRFYPPGPWAVAIGGPKGNVYVSDPLYNRVVEFDRSGNFLRESDNGGGGEGSFNFKVAQAMAVDRNGTVWVSSSGTQQIAELSSSLKIRALWKVPEPAPGASRAVHSLALGPGDLLYATVGNYLELLNRNSGQLMAVWGDNGARGGSFVVAEGVAVGENGVVYVSDEYQPQSSVTPGRILSFNSDGSPGPSWVNPSGGGYKPPWLNRPYGLATGRLAGEVFVADPSADRVQVFQAFG